MAKIIPFEQPAGQPTATQETKPKIVIPDKYAGRVYASPGELAEILGIDRVTWYRHYYGHVRGGRIQALKVGSALRIRISSFLAVLEQEEARHAA